MSEHATEPRASFTTMKDSTAADWAIIGSAFLKHAAGLADRVLEHLMLLEGDYGGFPVNRLEHSLQTATLAHRAGESEEYVVCALLHDIGDTLGALNHADIAAAILRPFVSDENHWMVAHHAIFQGYYFFHYVGLDRNMRDQFRDHPGFTQTARFCELYDNVAFDVTAKPMQLDAFVPMVRRVFSKPRQSIYLGLEPG